MPARTSAPSKWLTLLAACVGLAMLMVDTFIVNVAFPAIGRDLGASLSAAEWTVSGYVLMTGVFPLAMGRLGDMFGRDRVYLAGLAGFVLTSGLCGLAPGIEALILFRILQGIAAAVMMPLTLSIVTAAFPPEQRGLAIGIWGGVSGLGLIAGPILGGLLVTGDEWRWIFLINLPIGLAAVLFAILWIPPTRDPAAPRTIDWAGLAVLSGGLLLILFGVNRGNDLGWASPAILACFAAGALLLAAFPAIERRSRAPLVDLALFRSGPFVMASLSAFLFSAAVFGSQPYASLFMQNYLGLTPLQGGLAFLPATGLVAALMPVSGILGQRLGHRIRLIIIAGSLSVGLSFVYLLQLDTSSRYLDGLLPAFILRGLGIGLVISATSYAVVSSLPVAKSGLASGALTMARNIGTSAGVAVFGAVYLRSIETILPPRLADAGIEPGLAAALTGSATRFVPAPAEPAAAVTAGGIVDAYIVLAFVGIGISALAIAAAALIRPRPAAAPLPAAGAAPVRPASPGLGS
ncbi:DHA2 family efflux MFS transporter permease subunit [Tepidiforma sp.]|uniref:DHA2 family efflux MFS transporter permease subunit n=1 Tax=Tepidiforma sp. TaxID=2682230 RepID=UPI00262109A2|nr:DHA2 family efflux MFS transporter permease subunit [Tepidiforma sp.]MCX7618952.1 DHA2 family efflux MFS transporter permease subunit [Tepidiforma sp.]